MKLALFAGAWLVGLLLGFRLDLSPVPLILLAGAALSSALLLGVVRFPVWPAVLIAVLLAGVWRVEVAGTPPEPLVVQPSQQVTLRGVVSDDPEVTNRQIRFVLDVAAVDRGMGFEQLSGKTLVYAEPPQALAASREPPYFRQGDFLTVRGTLQSPEPIDEFDYPAYLANQSISGVFWSRGVAWSPEQSSTSWQDPIFAVRRKLAQGLESALPVPHSSLAQALLLGLRRTLPPEVVDDFRNTGTSHLLAISGMHVGILLVMVGGASAWALGRRRQVYLLAPLAAIWLYALISGLPVSVVRAALMGSIYLAALGLGRPQSALPPLALSAFIITAFDPLALKQVSFQLSFTAMAGIIIALPYQARVSAALQQGIKIDSPSWEIWLRSLAGWVASALIVSLGATLATLPLVAFSFGRVPLLGIPITILALPALPFILAGSLIASIAGLMHPLLGQMAGVTTWVPLSYLLGLVSFSPGITLPGSWISAPVVWGWYLALVLLLIAPKCSRYLKRLAHVFSRGAADDNRGVLALPRPSGSIVAVVGIGLILGIAGLLLWGQLLYRPDGELHVFFFDVGQGDSALIITPGGQQVLIDGGPGLNSASIALSNTLPVWDRSLDLVALTHLDADHSRGLLEVLDRYRVGAVLVGVTDSSAALSAQWQATITRNQVDVLELVKGQNIFLEDGVILETLHPDRAAHTDSSENRNNNSLVLRLVYGETSFLLTADIEAESERQLARNGLNLDGDVLKVAHHGSKTSTTMPFLQAASPTIAVISAGADNQFGHPHPDVIARLEQAVGPDRIFHTARDGTIEFISDGRSLWVQLER